MRIRTADFTADYVAIRRIRFAVFVDEQHVPEDLELDDRDSSCIHVLALGTDEQPIGTGRIDVAAAGKIGRVAVVAERRGRGIGTALMQRLHAIATEQRLNSVWCNAQIGALPFYEHLGYSATGEPFDEAGIAHIRMERTLTNTMIATKRWPSQSV